MFKIFSRRILLLLIFFLSTGVYSDSFRYNTYNNHGVIGLINIPSARFYKEQTFGFTLYDGTPDQKITMTSSPYDWLEASFFYTNIQGRPYPGYESFQDYKDKGFNFKIRIKEEGFLPAIAVGINDIAGTGLYSSEYIVGSYGLNNIDFHFGLGWGTLNGKQDFKNPLIYLTEKFGDRPTEFSDEGGQFQPSRYYSDQSISAFFGLSYVLNKNTIVKFERDTTETPGIINYGKPNSDFSFGIDYSFNDNFVLGLSFERNDYISLRFNYKRSEAQVKKTNYSKTQRTENVSRFGLFINNLEDNGIGVNKLFKKNDLIGIEVTQFTHPSLDIIEEIILSAKNDSGIEEEIVTNYKIADLAAIQNYSQEFEKDSRLIYTRKKEQGFNTNTRLNIRPFIGGREGFLKAALLVENESEYLFSDNFMFSSNLKYSIYDNFDELIFPPVDTYPAQVRSDVKDYLRNFNDGIIIGRAQLDYYQTVSENNHLMFTAGILEEMFSGYGIEYLHFNPSKNFAYGFEIFNVKKRDYELQFGTLNYENITGHVNFYYRNYDVIPFDLELSYGEYLAGDTGGTIELSRRYRDGMEFGVFATFTDVTSEQFGEGTFDKGIFFNIPIYKNLVNYTWRPLTKDPGAKLVRKNNLHDLLIKFRPFN